MPTHKINRTFIAQKLGDQVVIFDGSRSILYTLNETAGYIFQKIKVKKGVAEIIQLLTDKYNIDEHTASMHVKKLISDLIKRKIVLFEKPKK